MEFEGFEKEITGWHTSGFKGGDNLFAEFFAAFTVAHIDGYFLDASGKGFRVHEGSISDIEVVSIGGIKKVGFKFDKWWRMVRLDGYGRDNYFERL